MKTLDELFAEIGARDLFISGLFERPYAQDGFYCWLKRRDYTGPAIRGQGATLHAAIADALGVRQVAPRHVEPAKDDFQDLLG